MNRKINVKILSRISTPTVLSVHPQMTAKQLTEFVCASALLHRKKGELMGDEPIALVSIQRNLMIDYLLSSTETPISKINSLVEIIPQENKSDNMMMIQLNHQNCKNKILQGEVCLTLEVIYKDDLSHLSYRKLENERRSLLCADQNYPISQQIIFRKDIACFIEKKTISKDVVKRYEDIEKLIILKERMIKLQLHHVNIFGELISTSTSKESFSFDFKYTPCVPLKDILILDLNQKQVQILIDKIWIYLNHLRSNGFEDKILNYVSQGTVKQLFEKFEYDIEGNIHISDINLAEYETKPINRLNKSQEQMLLNELRNYIQASRIYLPLETEMWSKKEQNEKIDFYQFYWAFNKRKYVYHQLKIDKFQPLTNIFEWTKLTSSDQWKDMLEASTAKKPRKNVSMRQSRMKKDEDKFMQIMNKGKTKKNKGKGKEKNFSFFK